MATLRPLVNDFSAGELSPRLAGRVDIAAYHKGAQELTNFQVRLLGGISKRAGTEYLANTRNDAKVRLIPFAIDADTTFLVELSAGHTRFFCNGVLVTDAGQTAIDIANSYTVDELFEVRYAQTFHEMYLVHPSHAPFWVRFISGSATAAVFEYVDADQSFAGNLLSWTAPTDTPYDVYDLWEYVAQWLVPRKTYTATGTFNSKTLSSIQRLDLSVILTFSDTSTLTISRASTYSYQGTIEIDLRPFIGTGNYPAAVCYFAGRLWLGGSDNDPTTLWASKPWDYKNFVMCETIEYTAQEKTTDNRTDCTGETDSEAATEELKKTISGISPAVVAEALVGKYATGLYCAYGAKVVSNDTTSAVLDMVTIGAGTSSISFSAWKDANVPEYADVVETTQQIGAGNAIRIILATEEDERILWIAAAQDIYVGTTCSEWVIPGTSDATKAQAVLASRFGSANIQARLLGSTLLYVTSSSRHIRQMEMGGNASPPLTVQAEHMVRPGIIQLEFSQSPDIALYAVLADGTVIRCLIEPSMGVMAWDRVETRTGDEIESIAVTPGTDRDMVYLSVKRTIGGSTVRFVELLQENDDDIVADQWYVDAGISKTAAAFTTVSGLSHLNGETVAYRNLSAAGVPGYGTAVVSNGAITVPSSTVAIVGLPYSARLRVHRIDSTDTEGLAKGVGDVFFRLYRSCSFLMRYNLDATFPTIPITVTDTYTGPMPVTTDIPMQTDPELTIDSTDPVPVGIQSIVPSVTIGG